MNPAHRFLAFSPTPPSQTTIREYAMSFRSHLTRAGGSVRRIQPTMRSACGLFCIMLCLAAAQALVAVDTTSAATEPPNWFTDYADKDYQPGKFFQKRYFRNGYFKESGDLNIAYDFFRSPTEYPDIGTVIWRKLYEFPADGRYYVRAELKNATAKLYVNHTHVKTMVNNDQANLGPKQDLYFIQGYRGQKWPIDIGVSFGAGAYAGARVYADDVGEFQAVRGGIPINPQSSESDYATDGYTQKAVYVSKLLTVVNNPQRVKDESVSCSRSGSDVDPITNVYWYRRFIAPQSGTYRFTVSVANAYFVLNYGGIEGKANNTGTANQDYPFDLKVIAGQTVDLNCRTIFNGTYWNASAKLSFAFTPDPYVPPDAQYHPDIRNRADGDFLPNSFHQKTYTPTAKFIRTDYPETAELWRDSGQNSDVGLVGWAHTYTAPWDGTYTFTGSAKNGKAELKVDDEWKFERDNRDETAIKYWNCEVLVKKDQKIKVMYNVLFYAGWPAGAKLAADFKASPPVDAQNNRDIENRVDSDYLTDKFHRKAYRPDGSYIGSWSDVAPELWRDENQNQDFGLVGWAHTYTAPENGTWKFTSSVKNGAADLVIDGVWELFRDNDSMVNIGDEVNKTVKKGQKIKVTYNVRFHAGWSAGAKLMADFTASPSVDTTSQATEPMSPKPWYQDYADQDYQIDRFTQKRYLRNGNYHESGGDNVPFYFNRDAASFAHIGTVIWRRKIIFPADGSYKVRVALKNAKAKVYVDHNYAGFAVDSPVARLDLKQDVVTINRSKGQQPLIDVGVLFGAGAIGGAQVYTNVSGEFEAVPDSSPGWAHVNDDSDFVTNGYTQKAPWLFKPDDKNSTIVNSETVEFRRTGVDANPCGGVSWFRKFVAPKSGTYRFTVTIANARYWLNSTIDTSKNQKYNSNTGTGNQSYDVDYLVAAGQTVKMNCNVNFYGVFWNAYAKFAYTFTESNMVEPLAAVDAGFAWGASSNFPTGSYEMQTWTPSGTVLATTTQQDAALQRSQTQNQGVGIVLWQRLFKAPSAGTYTFTPSVTNGRSYVRINGRDVSVPASIPCVKDQSVQVACLGSFGAGWNAYAKADVQFTPAPVAPAASGVTGYVHNQSASDFIEGKWRRRSAQPDGTTIGESDVDTPELRRDQGQNTNVGSVSWRRAYVAPQAGVYTINCAIENGQLWMNVGGNQVTRPNDPRQFPVKAGDRLSVAFIAQFSAGWNAYAKVDVQFTPAPVAPVAPAASGVTGYVHNQSASDYIEGKWRRRSAQPDGTTIGQSDVDTPELRRDQGQNTNVGSVSWRRAYVAPQAGVYTITCAIENGQLWMNAGGIQVTRPNDPRQFPVKAGDRLTVAFIAQFSAGWNAYAKADVQFTPDPAAPPLAAVDAAFAKNAAGDYPTGSYQMKTWSPIANPVATYNVPWVGLGRTQAGNQNIGIARWRKTLTAPRDGTYLFTFTANNGMSWLSINDQEIASGTGGEITVAVKSGESVRLQYLCSFGSGWNADTNMEIAFASATAAIEPRHRDDVADSDYDRYQYHTKWWGRDGTYIDSTYLDAPIVARSKEFQSDVGAATIRHTYVAPADGTFTFRVVVRNARCYIMVNGQNSIAAESTSQDFNEESIPVSCNIGDEVKIDFIGVMGAGFDSEFAMIPTFATRTPIAAVAPTGYWDALNAFRGKSHDQYAASYWRPDGSRQRDICTTNSAAVVRSATRNHNVGSALWKRTVVPWTTGYYECIVSVRNASGTIRVNNASGIIRGNSGNPYNPVSSANQTAVSASISIPVNNPTQPMDIDCFGLLGSGFDAAVSFELIFHATLPGSAEYQRYVAMNHGRNPVLAYGEWSELHQFLMSSELLTALYYASNPKAISLVDWFLNDQDNIMKQHIAVESARFQEDPVGDEGDLVVPEELLGFNQNGPVANPQAVISARHAPGYTPEASASPTFVKDPYANIQAAILSRLDKTKLSGINPSFGSLGGPTLKKSNNTPSEHRRKLAEQSYNQNWPAHMAPWKASTLLKLEMDEKERFPQAGFIPIIPFVVGWFAEVGPLELEMSVGADLKPTDLGTNVYRYTWISPSINFKTKAVSGVGESFGMKDKTITVPFVRRKIKVTCKLEWSVAYGGELNLTGFKLVGSVSKPLFKPPTVVELGGSVGPFTLAGIVEAKCKGKIGGAYLNANGSTIYDASVDLEAKGKGSASWDIAEFGISGRRSLVDVKDKGYSIYAKTSKLTGSFEIQAGAKLFGWDIVAFKFGRSISTKGGTASWGGVPLTAYPPGHN